MGLSKLHIYDKETNEVAAIARVLAHPARVSILRHISMQDACICSDLVEEIGLAQPTISQHLKVINEAGLLKGNFEGKSICYCLDVERFNMFQDKLNTFFQNTKMNCC